jgi:hypothetical protein
LEVNNCVKKFGVFCPNSTAYIRGLGGTALEIRRSVVCDYLPYADGQSLKEGFYQKLAALQGHRNCWIVDGLMDFESVEVLPPMRAIVSISLSVAKPGFSVTTRKILSFTN